jgi:septal ring factor EnvC (AmiA/AmiB activator)
MQKILIILAASLSLISIGLGYVNVTHLQQTKADLAATTSDRDSTHKKLTSTSNDLKSEQDKATSLGKDVEKLQQSVTDIQASLDKTTADKTDLQKQLADKETELTQQKSDLAAKDARIAELENKGGSAVTQASPQQDELKKQLEEKEILNNSLQEKLKESDSLIADFRKKEADRKAKIMRNGLEGRILAVNPSWNFVILSLGDKNGVVNNAELLINRGGQLIGKVRITSVEPSTSVADIVVNSVRSGLTVQPGDTVIYRGPESSSANDSDSKL